MADDWASYDGGEATERILRAAINSSAREVHLSTSADGCTVFFAGAERIEFFDNLPPDCRDKVYTYLKNLAAIDDTWQQPPCAGYGVFTYKGRDYNLEVRMIKGARDCDIVVVLAPE